MRRPDPRWGLRASRLVAALAAAALAAGCAVPKMSSPFGTGSEGNPALTEDRLLESTSADASAATGQSAHCPQVVAWPRDRLVTVYQGGQTGDALSIVHRGEITKMSRECQLYGDRVVVKYGFAGRVLLGPKGRPGTVTLPVSVRVSGVEQRTLATDRMSIATTVPHDNPVGYFSMVREIAFPILVGTRPEDYKVFVAFDQPRTG